jgi:hypothetical protein
MTVDVVAIESATLAATTCYVLWKIPLANRSSNRVVQAPRELA